MNVPSEGGSAWDQQSVDRTMKRWSSEKQAKTEKQEANRTAETKFWRRKKQQLVLSKLKNSGIFSRMEARAQEAPRVAQAQWKALELQRNFGCWLRGSRGVRERAAQIGGECVKLWHRSDLLWSNSCQGVTDWQQNVVQQLHRMSEATPMKHVDACRSSAEILRILPDELTARILLTAGDTAMCRAACACTELNTHVEAPYMWQLLCKVRWAGVALNSIEAEMGWKFAYIRRDRVEKMTVEERQEHELELSLIHI
eukprot:TRINITY_DN23013_c0_g1_i1.p1 TRINITY_DN23013_c0_g1~~TRINITY_DN23013_c0_g1_i1.p1  ORF type:complete len:255 (-),score=71.04 TRINITY_DN23013_c0_g1_i1:102-866(-)